MELKTIFQDRRSVNFFDKTKPVSAETLKQIIELATLAPSAFNLQPWKIIAVKSPEAKQKLFDLSNKQPKVLEAPVTLIVVGDKNGSATTNSAWKDLPGLIGEEGTKGAQAGAAFLYASSEDRKTKFAESNGGLFAMALMYAAKELGVDSHPMSGLDFDGVKKAFDLAADDTVVMTIALGYFDTKQKLYPRRARKPYTEIVREV
jgi:putative NAD(P)H nitroreductase